MDDSEDIIKMDKYSFEACSTMVFMRGSEKRNDEESIHDFSIQYVIKNNKYLKTLQEAVDVMCKVKFKTEKNNEKSNTQEKNKNGGGNRYKLNDTSFSQT